MADVRVLKEHGGTWLACDVNGMIVHFGISWNARGPIRSRALLRATHRNNRRYGAPWLGPDY